MSAGVVAASSLPPWASRGRAAGLAVRICAGTTRIEAIEVGFDRVSASRLATLGDVPRIKGVMCDLFSATTFDIAKVDVRMGMLATRGGEPVGIALGRAERVD